MDERHNLTEGDLVLLIRKVAPQVGRARRNAGEKVLLGIYAEKIYTGGHKIRDAITLRGSTTIKGVTVPIVEVEKSPKYFKNLGKSLRIISGRDDILEYLKSNTKYSAHADLVESLE